MFNFKFKKTFFVTTAIDYPNSDPHLGHAYEKVIADVQARWHRLKEEKVFFLTGTDEHGLKIQRAAEKAGKKPQEFVDEQVKTFKKLCKEWNISYSRFIRTTDSDHKKIAQSIFKKVFDKGDIYLGNYEGLYCVPCEAFYLEKDLKQGKCPVHHTEPETVKEESYFFRLSKYQKQLLEFFEKNPEFISPKTRRTEIINRVKEGLRDLSVSRTSFKWGIQVSINPKHIQYVWFDALLNYYTATQAKKGLNVFWPADIHHIGKDISWFHCVIWPCILFAAGIKQPKKVFIHGFINTKAGDKLSKSSGEIINPIVLSEKFGVDQLRYFLLREIPLGQDGVFSLSALQSRVNNELANELGNLLNRTIALTEKKIGGKVSKQKTSPLLEKALKVKKISELMDSLSFNQALTEIFAFVSACNRFVNDEKPWEQSEKDSATTLYNLVDSLRVIAILLEPFIPETSEKINGQLGLKKGFLQEAKLGLLEKTKVKKGKILFLKIEDKEIEEKKQDAREIKVIVEKPVKEMGLKVFSGVIKNVLVKKKHEGLEKLKAKTVQETNLKEKNRQEIILEYENVYKKLGVSNAVNSVRNLDGLVEKSTQLPQINTAVDCYNIVSLKYGLVVGCHDIEKLKGNLRFAITTGKEKYVPLGNSENKGVAKGEFAVLDEKQVVCRLDEKQCEETKVNKKTKHLVFYVQGNSKTKKELLEKAGKEISELIVKYCGGKFRQI